MSRAAWIELSAFCCVVSLYAGLAVGFFIEGMESAAVIGTIPSWAFLLAVRFSRRLKV